MTGRKLLLADDSVTIQKVIDLTFTDEGMQVITVGDGEQAVRILNESTPDIVLADVLMPGLDGYRLCEYVKQDQRYGQIPVILLVGSFEPFDEAEARRVGADDFVTKPFQSIRQLVSRVGSLLGGKQADDEAAAREFSTLGLAGRKAAGAADVDAQDKIETASLTKMPDEIEEPEIEFQTADTLKFQPEQVADTFGHRPAFADAGSHSTETTPMERTSETVTSTRVFGDVLLDLDDLDADLVAPEADDAILDLGYETPVTVQASAVSEAFQPAVEFAGAPVATAVEEYRMPERHISPEPAESSWAIVADEVPVAEPVVTEPEEPKTVAAIAQPSASPELSPEAIDAIARRVVEQMSEKVVREIAWEIVPELSELLIKQRLDEQKH
jgi:CheY-like chemotaxis protein